MTAVMKMEVDGSTATARLLAIFFLVPGAVSLSIWELYLFGPGIRPLDFLGLACIFLSWCLALTSGRVSLETITRTAPVLLAVSVYVALGAVTDADNAKAGTGLALGMICLLLVRSMSLSGSEVVLVINCCLVLHLACFWIQLTAYHLAGTYINFLAFAGLQPRSFSTIFRATGLTMEPATFSLLCVMIVSLRCCVLRRLHLLDIAALGSAIASLSLWGLVATAVMLTVLAWRRFSLWIVAGVGVVLFLSSSRAALFVERLPMFSRLITLGDDPSANQRYGTIARALDLDWNSDRWFGVGVNVEYTEFGMNGVAYLLTAAGLVGAALFVYWLFFSALHGRRVFVVIAVALCATAGYMWTSFFWWFWIALLTNPSVGADTDRGPGSLIDRSSTVAARHVTPLGAPKSS
jgi:hypothetical protein